MSGPINSTGAAQGGVGVSPPGQERLPGSVDNRDADSFASQVDDGVSKKEEEKEMKDDLLELMKKSSFNEHSEKQKEMTDEIKKDLES